MGFYIRKSVSVGPFRFNLSKSGIGVSTGIRGFRVGTGPRGNYVQMGYGGIYFRQTIPNSHSSRIPPSLPRQESSSVDLKEIESGDVSQMVDSSSAALLEEINSKSKKIPIWPWALGFIFSVFTLLVIASVPIWVYCLLVQFCAAGLVFAVHADKLRKTVVLFYELAPHIEEAYQNLHNTFDQLRACSQIWHIDSSGDLRTDYDRKVNAGASTLIRRKGVSPLIGAPSYFKSNISIPVLPTGRIRLYFLPDRILVYDGNGVGAVSFDQLDIKSAETRFIETNGVPGDARIVDRTWRYVNKNGGPDRRFSNNRELPVVLYGEILLTSRSGLQELFQTSRTGLGIQLQAAARQMAMTISQQGDSVEEESYTKCPCNNCDVFIEFPTRGLGQKVTCPHCGMETVLFKPAVQTS